MWAHFLEHGTAKLGQSITANLQHAKHLARLVDASPALERLAPQKLQIVVFRFCDARLDEAALDALNDEIVVTLQERGIAVPSTTKIKGRLAIRVNLTNHRTRFEDLDLLVEVVVEVGTELTSNRV